jgi:cell division protein FtsQ
MARRDQRRQAVAKAPPPPPREWLWGLQVLAGVLLGAILLGGVGWGVAQLHDPATLPIRTVVIEGDLRHLDRTELEHTATPVVRGGFFTVDVAAVRAALVALPWVEAATVRRVWPDTLLVTVREQVPVARWGDKALVNARGRVFSPDPASFPEGLTQLRGPEGMAAQVLAEHKRMNAALGALGREVRMLELDGRRAWSLELDDGIRVVLGRSEVNERLGRFVRLWTEALAEQAERIENVDARYTNGLAVRWKQPTDGEGES